MSVRSASARWVIVCFGVLASCFAVGLTVNKKAILEARSILIVLHDAGESLALLPVVCRLLAERHARLLVLPLGEPATSIVTSKGKYSNAVACRDIPHITLPDLGIDVSVADGEEGRSQLLADSHLMVLTNKLGPKIAAVVTGMNYDMQCQIGSGLKDEGVPFAAYADGLSVLGTGRDPPSSVQLPFAQRSDEMWVPSLMLHPASPEWSHAGTAWHAVGQPTLETWGSLRANASLVREARGRIYGPRALARGSPTIVWFGEYGATYAESLRAWCQAAKALHNDVAFSSVLFALAVHPGPYGDVDRRVLREEGVEDLIAVVPEDIPGVVAALASNLTASRGSTGGEQSLFVGKPAIFVDPSGASSGERLGSVLGLIPTVHTSEAAVEAVRQVAGEKWSFDVSKLEHAGLPTHATDEIGDRMRQLVK